MSEKGNHAESWIQWALLIGTIIGALWNLSGRLATIEQQLHDDAEFHAEETKRLERLEDQMTRERLNLPPAHVDH